MSGARFISEQTTSKQRALIVIEHTDEFSKALKLHLIKHDIQVFISPHIPEDSHFDLCFIIAKEGRTKKLTANFPLTYITFHSHKKTVKTLMLPPHQKMIHIIGDEAYGISQIQTVIWFSISGKQHSPILTLESMNRHTANKKRIIIPQKRNIVSFTKHILQRFITSLLIFACITYVFSFWIPLSIASYYSYKSGTYLLDYNLTEAKKKNDDKERFLSIASLLYKPVRPVYLLFSLAQFSDDLFVVNTTTTKLIPVIGSLTNEAQQLAKLMIQRPRNELTARQTRGHFDKTLVLLTQSEEYILTIYRKIPPYLIQPALKDKFQKKIAQMRKMRKVFTLLPELLGEKNEQTILLLFANNMELRPGGGFIGSFAIANTHYFGLQDLQILDVYDADGQLSAHVAPPNPIKVYLNQPHWFLRDSAFFPDFYDTYQQATFFLQKELGISSWSGAALITTSGVKNIIGAFDELQIPDYKEKITKDNFYIKTQYYAEHGFFPGSTQKKSFLTSVVQQLLSQAELADPLLLSTAIVEGFDQKNMVLFMNAESSQKKLDELYWSGRLATPFCPTTAKLNCYADFQFPLDANLGVNKTNFFVDQTYTTKTVIDDSGLINTTVTIDYVNNSLSEVFPGGIYKNYFQILLPADSQLTTLLVDGDRLPSYDSETGKNKVIGFFMEIPPQGKKTVVLSYNSSLRFKKGKAIYQLVIQKQIGAQSHDVNFELQLPDSIHLLNTNFSPLVKNSRILYNTDLSNDRVFFIELLKE